MHGSGPSEASRRDASVSVVARPAGRGPWRRAAPRRRRAWSLPPVWALTSRQDVRSRLPSRRVIEHCVVRVVGLVVMSAIGRTWIARRSTRRHTPNQGELSTRSQWGNGQGWNIVMKNKKLKFRVKYFMKFQKSLKKYRKIFFARLNEATGFSFLVFFSARVPVLNRVMSRVAIFMKNKNLKFRVKYFMRFQRSMKNIEKYSSKLSTRLNEWRLVFLFWCLLQGYYCSGTSGKLRIVREF